MLLNVKSVNVFVLAVVLPYSPLAFWLGFVPMPLTLLGALAILTVTYLAAVYGVKRWFFRHYHLD